MYENKIKWCPVCNQGWVEIVKDKITQILFLSCNECETEWEIPTEIKSNNGTQNKYGQIENPTLEEIKAIGWQKYILDE